MAVPVLALDRCRVVADNMPGSALSLRVEEGDFVLIEVPGPWRGAGFADICSGLLPLIHGEVRFLGRDWSSLPAEHADALRGHIGRLFHQPLRSETADVARRVLLGQMHHTRIPEAELRERASVLALRFGLPGLPSGPARLLSEPDLLRAACVRAFLGDPRLLMLELPLAAQQDDLLPALLSAGAEARGRGAAVVWLAALSPAMRDPSIRPTQRLRLTDVGMAPVRAVGG
jgi:phospholipid/cholesterol/gamma-HCH transport system ATP-binding protein